ncbi:MAG: hypothetical protein LQ337_005617 [Flavoplaca oasis]|nr:MAG: hypothetical protein LQ337_005617 [Flavoplaca oasis]
MTRRTVAVSAPGKVLVAGGYLVLDRSHTGLVFGLDARIHVHVQKLPPSTGVVLSEIVVRSPQFRDAEWRYGYSEVKDHGGFQITQLKGVLLQRVCSSTLRESSLTVMPICVTILADADYYSHPGSTARTDPARFIDFEESLSEAHKTGLGSSAALVTAFVAAVLTYHLDENQLVLRSDSGRRRLHNLAQAAHCAAQGKVGSGFDVAAAVYGSCVYKRFSPSILEELGEVGSPQFSKRLTAVVEELDASNTWDMQIDKAAARIPCGLRLAMCDVDCGSESVGMAKKVLGWRKENADEAALLWATLQKGNEELAVELLRLAEGTTTDSRDYKNLSDIFLTIRSLIREMSAKAEVPIEPKVQTELLDACCGIHGVVGGVVPGAGGFDAIALLVENDALPSLQRFLDTYKTPSNNDSGPGIGKVRLLSVQQDWEGLRSESVENYTDWIR